MPTVMILHGFRFFFYSKEESRIHVHVERSGFEAEVWLDTFDIAFNYGFKDHELLVIQKLVRRYEKEIKKTWTTYFN